MRPPVMQRARLKAQTIKNAIFTVIAVILPLVLVEAAFRLLPISSPPYLLPVSERSPVARFQPDTDYVYSSGWNFSIRTNKHSNNYGYISPLDYDPGTATPLVTVIGDSYVEAHQVDSGRSTVDLLSKQVEGRGRVYGIGLSGAPLSQYLVFADFARATFRPDAMAFVIIGNDFDESLLKYNAEPRFHYFEERGDDYVLTRIDYTLSGTKILLRQSAVIRYLMHNLSAKENLERLFAKRSGVQQIYVGNVPAMVTRERLADSMRAVDEFFRRVGPSTGLGPQSVLFVLDGLRPALYSLEGLSAAEDSYASVMMRYFKERALLGGYEVLDMQPVFAQHYSLYRCRFEFATDGHWNELGHRLVADAIGKSRIFADVFGGPAATVRTRASC